MAIGTKEKSTRVLTIIMNVHITKSMGIPAATPNTTPTWRRIS